MTRQSIVAAVFGAAVAAVVPAHADDSIGRAPAALCATAAIRPLTHVRAADPDLAEALADGLRRSPTLASLVERIESSAGIVFLFRGPFYRLRRGTTLRGAMSHEVTVTPPFRIIKIAVEPRLGDRTIATLGHELRHALEVLEDSSAVDKDSVEGLYRRIGYGVSVGQYETSAAHDAERGIFRDLGRCKTR